MFLIFFFLCHKFRCEFFFSLFFVSCYSLSTVYQLSKECQSLIPHYDLIQEVNITRNNLLQTKTQLEELLSLPKKVVLFFDVGF